MLRIEMGIYQIEESLSKKERKHAFDQEKKEETRFWPRKTVFKKKRKKQETKFSTKLSNKKKKL